MKYLVLAAAAALLIGSPVAHAASASHHAPKWYPPRPPELTDSERALFTLLTDYAIKSAVTHEHTPAIPLEDARKICESWGVADSKQVELDDVGRTIRPSPLGPKLYIFWPGDSFEPRSGVMRVRKSCAAIEKSKAIEVRLF